MFLIFCCAPSSKNPTAVRCSAHSLEFLHSSTLPLVVWLDPLVEDATSAAGGHGGSGFGFGTTMCMCFFFPGSDAEPEALLVRARFEFEAAREKLISCGAKRGSMKNLK